MGAWALARGSAREASQYGERGLAIADRYGYTAWAIHRLLPLVIESDLWLQRYDRVAERAARLRADAEAFEHRLGLAWADAADGFVRRLRDQDPLGTRQLLLAADALDAIPFVLHAARLRRHAAPLLAADGDHTAAVRALRRAHETFARLGADRELRETRSLLRSLGVRLPARTVPAGASALTARELEIARAIADRRTNKEIGVRFGISARTVSTHLSNIFHKLGVSSRGALADKVRDDPALRGP
jgi:DNA-binding CsgD family transcriptional regulator